MKKLYSIALAAIVALSASAERPLKPTDQLQFPAKATYELNMNGMEAVKAPAPMSKLKKAAPSRAEELTFADYMGEYDWSFLNLIKGTEGASTLVITAVDEATGKVKISGFPQNLVVEATLDLTKKTLSIANNQLVGKDSDGDIYFYGKTVYVEPVEGSEESKISLGDGAIKDAAIVGTIEEDVISFDPYTAWALGDPKAENLGWWLLSCANEMAKALNWYNIGQGQIMENILYPIATEEENKKYTTVDIQTCDEIAGAFRVLDPLKATYSALKIKSESPAMVFLASNPADVLIFSTDSGLSTKELGELYYFNWAMLYAVQEVATPEEYACTMTVEGKKHTVTCAPGTILIMPEKPVSDEELFYTLKYPTIITFNYDAAGLSNVVVEDENAPVEYFNLQGIRVANPENGIFIRRQGNTATKVRL